MPNQEHLDLLKQGVDAWNKWREEHPEIQPDLLGADLPYKRLESADLRDAHLEGALLRGAHLEGALLRGAHLEGANLAYAHLEGANLVRVDLKSVNLRDAHLEGANLVYAHLEGANLRQAFFDATTNLEEITLGDEEHGFALVADLSWGDVNLTVVDWSQVKMLGDEYVAREKQYVQGVSDKNRRLNEYKMSVRANRQLANQLEDQGLIEEAIYCYFH